MGYKSLEATIENTLSADDRYASVEKKVCSLLPEVACPDPHQKAAVSKDTRIPIESIEERNPQGTCPAS